MTRKIIDRKAFFDHVRKSLFGGQLSKSQVANMSAILDAIEACGIQNSFHAAHPLATAFIEVGRNMAPIREGFKLTDAAARKYVSAQGYKYAVPMSSGQVGY